MTNSERRTYQRYLAPGLSILLKSIRVKAENLNPIQLTALDFNSLGMAVQSSHNFKIGDELRVVISDGFNHVVDVACFVCNRAKTTSGYRCGLHFLELSESDITTRQSLISMEQQLDNVLQFSAKAN